MSEKCEKYTSMTVNGLEKTVVTHGTVLRTRKDEGLGADETDAKHVLHTLEVPPNGYVAAEQEAELQPIRESYTSLNPLGANPYLPTGYMLSTWWILKQNTQHGPTESILITF